MTLSQLVLDGRNQFGHSSPRIASGADGAKLIDNDITSRSTSQCVWLDGDPPTDIDNLDDPSWIKTVEVRHNRFHDCVNALEIEHAQQPAVTDNLFIDNTGSGIRLSTNTDYANVSHNVIDGSTRSVTYVAGTDLNWVGQNAISSPASYNLTAASPPGTLQPLFAELRVEVGRRRVQQRLHHHRLDAGQGDRDGERRGEPGLQRRLVGPELQRLLLHDRQPERGSQQRRPAERS